MPNRYITQLVSLEIDDDDAVSITTDQINGASKTMIDSVAFDGKISIKIFVPKSSKCVFVRLYNNKADGSFQASDFYLNINGRCSNGSEITNISKTDPFTIIELPGRSSPGVFNYNLFLAYTL